MSVCSNCGQANPPIAKFCLACGSSLADASVASPPEPTEERKLVTGVFVDVVGSTARAESLDPEDVRALLAPYHARARAELERLGGTVEKFIGDAVFALFGAPVAHEDDAERAVRSAFGILAAVADLNRSDDWLDLHIRVGVHTGEALVMMDAKPGEGEWMAAGDIVNTAARIQSGAAVDGVLVGEITRDATRDVVDYEEAEPISAKGKAEPVRVWIAHGIRPDRREPSGPGTALVGRDSELETLAAEWESLRSDRRAAIVSILGPAGIGKSSLLREFTNTIASSGRVLSARCLPYGEGITYWPVIEMLKQLAGILQSDSAKTDATKLGQLLEGLPTSDADELRTMAAAVANLCGASTTPAGTYSAEEIGQAELHWGVRRVLQLTAVHKPLVLVFEDLHWAEPTLLELLRFLVADSAGVPLLVVCSARPEFKESDSEFLAAGALLELEALDDSAGRAMLAALAGAEAASGAPAEALLKHAGGNPLFLEELIRMLSDRSLLSGESWHEQETLEELAVPTSLQALISARLDRLAPREKRVAQHASVVGHVFWPGAVAHIEQAATVETALMDALERLQQRDFVHQADESSVAGEREYGFKHALIHDVAYGQLPKGQRIPMHSRFADWVAALPGAEDEFVEIVAWHLEQACRLAKEVSHHLTPPPVEEAVEALMRAAEKSERREGLREADRYYERALELVEDTQSVQHARLRLRRGVTLTALGDLKQACEELVQAERVGRDVKEPEVRCAALIALAEVDRRQGRVSEARARLTEAETIPAGTEGDLLRIKWRFVHAALRANSDAEGELALSDLRQAVALAQSLDDHPLIAEGQLRTAAVLMNLGRLSEAEQELESCLEGASAMGSHKVEAEATAWLSGMKYYLGDTAAGKRLGSQAAEWLERIGDTYFLVQDLVWLATYALLEDDPETAEVDLRRAVPFAVELGGWIVIQVYRYLAEALGQQGRTEEAQDLVVFAARSLPEEDAYARCELLIAQGAVAAAAGESATVSTAYGEALRLLKDLNMPAQLAETRLGLARALRTLGDVAGARIEYMRARGAFSRMGAQRLLEIIDADLLALDDQRARA